MTKHETQDHLFLITRGELEQILDHAALFSHEGKLDERGKRECLQSVFKMSDQNHATELDNQIRESKIEAVFNCLKALADGVEKAKIFVDSQGVFSYFPSDMVHTIKGSRRLYKTLTMWNLYGTGIDLKSELSVRNAAVEAAMKWNWTIIDGENEADD